MKSRSFSRRRLIRLGAHILGSIGVALIANAFLPDLLDGTPSLPAASSDEIYIVLSGINMMMAASLILGRTGRRRR